MRVISFLKGIRKHWKKSTFAACALSYGLSYINDNRKIRQVMRVYCEEAAKYGDITINAQADPKRVLVILNPAANKKSAEKQFEKYCEPILHLAGYLVDIVQTDSVGHARRYIESLESIPDAILIAGGDGTVSETVTGLLRRFNKDEQCPLGILPVGRTNATLLKYFNLPENPNNVEKIREYASSAIAIVRGKTERKHIMKVQVLSESTNTDGENSEKTIKPIYAMNSLQWGAFKDAQNLRDKYWYLGPLREYAATLFNAFSSEKLTWNCNAVLKYTPPCKGCSNCYVKEEQKSPVHTRWWSRFVPKFKLGQQSNTSIDYSKIVNENCNKQTVIEIKPTEIILGLSSQGPSKLKVNVTEAIDNGFDFIKENWKRIKTGKINTMDLLEGRTIELIPENLSSEVFYFIDNEPYEVRAVKISVIPSAVNVFVP